MKILLKCHGCFGDVTGRGVREYELARGDTVGDLIEELVERHGDIEIQHRFQPERRTV